MEQFAYITFYVLARWPKQIKTKHIFRLVSVVTELLKRANEIECWLMLNFFR